MDGMDTVPIHPAALPGELLLNECSVSFTRRSGPGGQHRNKVETAAVLVHRPSGLQAEANERRSQAENRQVALRRLRLRLALELRLPVQEPAVPSALWSSRLRGQRIVVSAEHDDFPALLAEALDVVAGREFDLPAAAAQLQCSTSQLLRLLQLEPKAMLQVNQSRRQRGLRPLA